MRSISKNPPALVLIAVLTMPVSASLAAQQAPTDPNIVVNGERLLEPGPMTAGPEIKGVISARNGEKLKITSADGTGTIIAINDATKIKAGGGLFGGNRGSIGPDALLNGLPVTVKTLRAGDGLVASQISFRNNDLKTANMIRNGTAQRFDEQTAATEALRGRMGRHRQVQHQEHDERLFRHRQGDALPQCASRTVRHRNHRRSDRERVDAGRRLYRFGRQR